MEEQGVDSCSPRDVGGSGTICYWFLNSMIGLTFHHIDQWTHHSTERKSPFIWTAPSLFVFQIDFFPMNRFQTTIEDVTPQAIFLYPCQLYLVFIATSNLFWNNVAISVILWEFIIILWTYWCSSKWHYCLWNISLLKKTKEKGSN